ncbi:MAG: geranylgeranyl reductase family protein [Verrucomicrobiota bacterium]|jgi:geranylgeranyl reductase family protein
MRVGSTNCFDVGVIGAGPAGCSAALAAAQAGHSVVLLEQARLPRYKTCGGGVLARAFDLLPPGAASIVERRFDSVALNFLGTDLNFVATRPQPMVHMTMRSDLDQFLARQAEQAGVRVIDSCPVKRVDAQPAGLEIIAGRERYPVRFVIAADGIHSRIARAGGWPDLPALAPALEHEIYLPGEDFARFSRRPRFDFNVIDAGYAWVFPKRAHLSVGILSTRQVCPDLLPKLADYLRQIGLTRIERTERHGYLIPLAPRSGPLARGRVLLVGDAAGLADPVTAEGISNALQSGRLAAAALAAGRMDPAAVAANYQSLLETHILRDLRAARFLAGILYRRPQIRNRIFRMSGQKLCDFTAKVIMGETSYRDAMKRPSSYFKLLGWNR